MELRTDLRARLRRSRQCAAAVGELEHEFDALRDDEPRPECRYALGILAEGIIPAPHHRASGLCQRALHAELQSRQTPSQAWTLSRAPGRVKMVAQLGKIEPSIVDGEPSGVTLTAEVGEAQLDCGEVEGATALLAYTLSGTPDSLRIRDAIAALQGDPELWNDMIGSQLRSLIAAFALLCEQCSSQSTWDSWLALADSCLDRLAEDERLFVALQAASIACKELGDAERARPYFDIVRQIEPAAPDLTDFEANAEPPQG